MSRTKLLQRVVQSPVHGKRALRSGFVKLTFDEQCVHARVLYQQDMSKWSPRDDPDLRLVADDLGIARVTLWRESAD
jgi:hypothetical protein